MKITIVYQYYQSHAEPGHSLIYELAHYLADSGHDVTVVAGEFGYMKRRSSGDRPWYQRLLRREADGKVKVIRAYTYSELHRSYFGRLCSFLSFSLFCPFGMLMAEKPDVVLASSPPIFPMVPAWVVSKLRGVPFVLEVRDVWPEAAVQMGILHNRMLIKIMSWMERLLYDRSNKIVALTEGIRKDICARGWPEKKIVSIPCGVNAGFCIRIPKAAAAFANATAGPIKKSCFISARWAKPTTFPSSCVRHNGSSRATIFFSS